MTIHSNFLYKCKFNPSNLDTTLLVQYSLKKGKDAHGAEEKQSIFGSD